MNSFPPLKTGAVLQVPSSRIIQFSTDIVQFVDGAEQRFAAFNPPLHHWTVNYVALDETELQSVRNFVRQTQGSVNPFSFTDPWSGTVYPNCSLAEQEFSDSIHGLMSCKANLVIREIRS